MRTDTDVISGQTEAADRSFMGTDTDVMTDGGGRWACHGADRCYDRPRQQIGLSCGRHRCYDRPRQQMVLSRVRHRCYDRPRQQMDHS